MAFRFGLEKRRTWAVERRMEGGMSDTRDVRSAFHAALPV